MGRVGASRQWTEGETIVGEYRVESKLGEGGMGSVYLVSHLDDRSILFAVKRTRTRDETSRRAFLAELQTWIDLPEHPNLAACRFFRTEDDEVLIFADYLPGGSLSLWIARGRLATLESVLDVAVQFAWGLHQAHELGLVHQDVKPGNVLMTEHGIAKVTDFGLSRARSRAESGRSVVGLGQGLPGASLLVSSGGLTPAYCSPEQAEGQRLSRASDQWSWAVSVLEMFTGEVTWGYGPAAREALAAYTSAGYGRLPMPGSVASVLRRCLEQSPGSRYGTMEEVAEELRRAYEREIRQTHARCPPLAVSREQWAHGRPERRTIYVSKWRHPREWLELALSESGRDLSEVEAILPDYSGSRRAQLVADFAAYEEAYRLLSGLASQRRHLEPKLAALCTDKGMVHHRLDDLPGARAMHEQAARSLERLAVGEGRTELLPQLAVATYNQAWCAFYPRPDAAMLQTVDRTIALLGHLVTAGGRQDLSPLLVSARSLKGLALATMGRGADAMRLLKETTEWAEQLWGTCGPDDLLGPLGAAYHFRAVSEPADAAGARRSQSAEMTARRAVELLRQLVYDRGRHEVLYPLAEACNNLAAILRAQGRPEDALELSRWSVQATEQLVADQGRDDLVVGLAMANLVLGRSLVSLQRLAEGCEALWRAAEAIRAGVYLMGRVDQWASLASIHIEAAQASWHAGDRARAAAGFRVALRAVERRPDGALLCAKAHTGCARVLWDLAEHPSARDHAAKAVDLWSRLVRGGLPQHSPDLAHAQGMYAVLAMACGDITGAAQLARQAIPALRAEATRTGRADLRQLLDVLATHFGRIA